MDDKPDSEYPMGRLLFLGISILPAYWVVNLYLLALQVRLMLGYWPSFGTPDPYPGFLWLMLKQAYLLMLLTPSIGFMLPLMLFLWVRDTVFRTRWLYRLAAVLYLVGYAVFWFVLTVDPGKVWDWFID